MSKMRHIFIVCSSELFYEYDLEELDSVFVDKS